MAVVVNRVYFTRNRIGGGAIAAMVVIPVLTLLLGLLGLLLYRNRNSTGKAEKYKSVVISDKVDGKEEL